MRPRASAAPRRHGGQPRCERADQLAARPRRRAIGRPSAAPPAGRLDLRRQAPSEPPRAPLASSIRVSAQMALRRSSGRSPRRGRAGKHRHRGSPAFASCSIARRCTAGRASSSRAARSVGDERRPGDLQPARVGNRRRGLAPNAVDRAEHVGLGQLRGRAAELVPGAGVDDEQAAVGVFDDVGRVEVEAVGDEEIARRGS